MHVETGGFDATFSGDFSGPGGIVESGSGLLTLTGSSNLGGNFLIGNSAMAQISGGGVLSDATGAIGYGSAAATVSGAGSSWTNTGNLFAGYSGTGTVTVTTGGALLTDGNSYIGFNAGSSGGATVSGSGSTWTHSCAYSINPFRRNLKDDQLKALAKNGGVVFVNFFSGFVDSSFFKKYDHFLAVHKTELDSLTKIYNDEDLAADRLCNIHKSEADLMRPPLSLLIKHIDYIAKLIGVDHVGIGSDFDGAPSYPMGMDDVTDYPKITAELLKLGYTEKDIDKILGGNFLRVLKANTGK